jgi:hypothetical protein
MSPGIVPPRGDAVRLILTMRSNVLTLGRTTDQKVQVYPKLHVPEARAA